MKRFLLVILLAARAQAHDFWIEPSSYRPAKGEEVLLSLRVGENFAGDPVSRSARRIVAFTARDGDGSRPVGGAEGADPAGVITAGATPAVVGYHSNFASVELEKLKFEAYLREEGLENRVTVRHDGLQRERYARFAKAQLGEALDPKPFGWRFELVPIGPGRFQALYAQKPLAGTLVIALSRDGKRVSVRTDAEGMARFDLDAGEWMVKTVHMVPAPSDSGFDWESLWASLTFRR